MPDPGPQSSGPPAERAGASPASDRQGVAVDGAGRTVPRWVLLLSLFLLFVIWSNSFHAVAYFRKDVGISAPALVTLRYGPVTVFCLAYAFWRRKDVGRLLARDRWRLLFMAALMIPGYNLALNWGQGRVPPATASLLIAMNPVFTFLLALAFLGERVRAMKLIGLMVSFLGVYLLIRAQQQSEGSTYIPYALVVLLAPLSWALATVLGKPATGRNDPLLVTFAATGIGSLPFTIALLAGADGTHETLVGLTATGWAALLHLSLLCTIVGFAVWFWALRYLPASTVSAFVFLNPPLTALFGMVWGTEELHWSTVAYGSITLAGVAMSAGIFRRTKRPAALEPQRALPLSPD